MSASAWATARPAADRAAAGAGRPSSRRRRASRRRDARCRRTDRQRGGGGGGRHRRRRHRRRHLQPGFGDQSPDALASLRRREVYAAVSALAPRAQVQLLGLPDGRLAEHAAELVDALERRGTNARTWCRRGRGDRHPDYEACSRSAADVRARGGARHWQFPIRVWAWAQPDGADLPAGQLRGVRLDDAAVRAKAAAIECHVSQHQPLPAGGADEPILDAAMLEHFRRDDGDLRRRDRRRSRLPRLLRGVVRPRGRPVEAERAVLRAAQASGDPGRADQAAFPPRVRTRLRHRTADRRPGEAVRRGGGLGHRRGRGRARRRAAARRSPTSRSASARFRTNGPAAAST